MDLKERLFAQIALKLELLTQEQVAKLLEIQSSPGERRHLSKIAADTGIMEPGQIKLVQAQRKRVLQRLESERTGATAQRAQGVMGNAGNGDSASLIADLTAEAVLELQAPSEPGTTQQGVPGPYDVREGSYTYDGSLQMNALHPADGPDLARGQPNETGSWDRNPSNDLSSELFDDTPSPPFHAQQAEQSCILEPAAFDRRLSSRPSENGPSGSSLSPSAKEIPVTGPGGGLPKARKVFKRPVRDTELASPEADDAEDAGPAATLHAQRAETPPRPVRVDPLPQPGRAETPPRPVRVDPPPRPGRADPPLRPGRADPAPRPGRADPPETPPESSVYHVYMPSVPRVSEPAPVSSAFPPARARSITHQQVPGDRDTVADREVDDEKPKPKKKPFLVRALLLARKKGASDLHLHAGAPVMARIDGRLAVLSSSAPANAADAEKVIAQIMTDAQWAELAQQGEVDFAFETPDGGRYRVNAYRQQRGTDIVFRLIPSGRITLESLRLPAGLKKLAEYRNGIVLCTGPMGCGKSTTLAALLHALISTRREHVITIENPIEHVLTRIKSQVTQRQIGLHTGSFSRALRAALREDPDVIVVTELRDRETISLAMSAAETGHLVLGTLHTGNATQTVNRIISAFPADEQAQARVMLSESLRAVVSQRLVRRAGGPGRVPAVEVLMVTTAVSAVIREGQTFKIPSMMQTGRAQGMVTLDASLQQLVNEGVVSLPEARRHAVDRSRFGGASAETANRDPGEGSAMPGNEG